MLFVIAAMSAANALLPTQMSRPAGPPPPAPTPATPEQLDRVEFWAKIFAGACYTVSGIAAILLITFLVTGGH